MTRPRTAALVAAVLVLTTLAVPLAAATSTVAGDGPDSNETAPIHDSGRGLADSDGGLQLSDLEPEGTRPEYAPDSVRASGTYGEFAMKHLPTGLFVNDAPESDSWDYLERGTVVNHDTLQLWSKRGYGLEDRDVTIRVAHYQVSRQQISANGVNRTVPLATNVTNYSRTATVGGGYDYIELELRSHYQAAHRTVVCVDQDGVNCLENPGTIRWTFNHKTSKAAQSATVDSRGEQLGRDLLQFFVPFLLFGGISLYATSQAVKRAMSKPRIPWWFWPATAVGGLVGLIVFWNDVETMLIRAPWLLAVLSGLLSGLLAALWFGHETLTGAFIRLRATDYEDELVPAPGEGDADVAADGGELAPERVKEGLANGRLKLDIVPVKLANDGDNGLHHIADGFLNWIARARGARAPLTADNGLITTSFDIGLGPYDKAFVLDPEAPESEVMQAEAERHEWNWPDYVWRDENGWHIDFKAISGTVVALGMSLGIGQLALGNPLVGLVVGVGVLSLWRVATPADGHLEVKLAPAHYSRALATVLSHAEEIGDARSLEYWVSETAETKMDKALDRKDLTDEQAASQMGKITERHIAGASDQTSENTSTEGSADD